MALTLLPGFPYFATFLRPFHCLRYFDPVPVTGIGFRRGVSYNGRGMSREPRTGWIIFGGCCLAFLAAAVNAGFLIELGTSVSHLTGDVSRVAMESPGGSGLRKSGALFLFIATLGFVLGATASGYFIHHPAVEFSRPYGRAITSIGFCLILAHFTFTGFPSVAVACGSFACGLQNALATRYRGVVLRTTHVTGLLTDFGTNLGMRLKGHHIERWKLLVPIALVSSFFIGAVFGSLLNIWQPRFFLLILGGIYFAGGIGWTVSKHFLLNAKLPR